MGLGSPLPLQHPQRGLLNAASYWGLCAPPVGETLEKIADESFRYHWSSAFEEIRKVLYAREGAKNIMDNTFYCFPWHVKLEIDGSKIDIPQVSILRLEQSPRRDTMI